MGTVQQNAAITRVAFQTVATPSMLAAVTTTTALTALLVSAAPANPIINTSTHSRLLSIRNLTLPLHSPHARQSSPRSSSSAPTLRATALS